MIGIGLGSILGGLLLIWASQVGFFTFNKVQEVLVLIAALARLGRYEEAAEIL